MTPRYHSWGAGAKATELFIAQGFTSVDDPFRCRCDLGMGEDWACGFRADGEDLLCRPCRVGHD